MITEVIQKILAGNNLTEKEATDVLDFIMTGEASEDQICELLKALIEKGESTEEIIGFVKSMRHHSLQIIIDRDNIIDGCGTGGDGTNSFNISTAAAIVASSAGATVAKHGNRSVSSKCGSADILEAMGANIDPGADKVQSAIEDIGFGFLFAPRFHPAMKYAVGPRKQLGVRTFFNILGPMTNPAGVKRQVIGVFSDDVMLQMAEVLQATGSEHILLVRSEDGMDEFSVSAPTNYVELKNNSIQSGNIAPTDVGLPDHHIDVIAGSDPEKNVQLFKAFLSGEKNGLRDAVLFNAGAMLYIARIAETIKEGVTIATKAVDSTSALNKFNEWVTYTNQ